MIFEAWRTYLIYNLLYLLLCIYKHFFWILSHLGAGPMWNLNRNQVINMIIHPSCNSVMLRIIAEGCTLHICHTTVQKGRPRGCLERMKPSTRLSWFHRTQWPSARTTPGNGQLNLCWLSHSDDLHRWGSKAVRYWNVTLIKSVKQAYPQLGRQISPSCLGRLVTCSTPSVLTCGASGCSDRSHH